MKLILIAMLLDHIMGDPANWPHPIRFVGYMIKKIETLVRSYFKNLYVGGFVLLISMVLVCTLPIFLLKFLVPPFVYSAIQVYFLYSLLATKCMAEEAKKVIRALKTGDLNESRRALSWLVGRDTASLSEEGVIAGCVETVAENTIDGTIAPLFYMFLGAMLGDPLLFVIVYKVTNTLDSMVGYIQAPYTEIGFASAKFDDILNYLPARIGSIFMLFSGALLGMNYSNGIRILSRDKRNHKSPNCAYPEAAVAGLLDVQLGGTHTYFGQKLEKPTIGDKNRNLEMGDISKTIHILYGSEVLIAVLFGIILFIDFIGGKI